VSAEQLFLWRHGRTRSNAEGRFQGQIDVELDDVGRAESDAAATALAEQVGGDAARGRVRIVSSDLRRCTQTARPLASRLGLTVDTDRALRERSCGQWEGLLRADVEERFPEDYGRWQSGEDVRIGGGESVADAAARTGAAITHHAELMDGGTLVVVCHGAAVRGAMAPMIGLDPHAYSRVEVLRNGHWAVLRRRREAWVLSAYNVGVTARRDP
jgi:glucosyl-3-phosphoglycerate phosphatase